MQWLNRNSVLIFAGIAAVASILSGVIGVVVFGTGAIWPNIWAARRVANPPNRFLKRADETKRRASLMRQAAVNGGGLQAARSSPDAERSGS